MLVGTDVCVRMVFVWEETHLSDLVTTWPSHMPMPGIEPGLQRWEASALTLRQPDILLSNNKVTKNVHNTHNKNNQTYDNFYTIND